MTCRTFFTPDRQLPADAHTPQPISTGRRLQRRARFRLACALVFGLSGHVALGFESTKVLPQGVRNITIKTANTELQDMSSDTGSAMSLAHRLNKDLTFKNVVNGKKGFEKTKLQGLLQLYPQFSNETALGAYSADLKADVQVIAPVVAYGLTDRLTLAMAVPYYRAATDIQVGFVQTDTTDAFLGMLLEPTNNFYASMEEAYEKLSFGVTALNDKLDENGYRTLEPWQGSGIADITLAAKYLAVDTDSFKQAVTLGVVLPTGKLDDPDILTDLPFGDGTVDPFVQLAFDIPATNDIVFNQYAKFTYQAPSRRAIRLQTDDESIEVPRADVDYKLGDKWEAGVSVQHQPDWGLILGLGYVIERKYADNYETAAETAGIYEEFTDQYGRHVAFKLGYSTLPAFQANEFPIPLSAEFGLKRHVASKNLPIRDIASFDFSVFF